MQQSVFVFTAIVLLTLSGHSTADNSVTLVQKGTHNDAQASQQNAKKSHIQALTEGDHNQVEVRQQDVHSTSSIVNQTHFSQANLATIKQEDLLSGEAEIHQSNGKEDTASINQAASDTLDAEIYQQHSDASESRISQSNSVVTQAHISQESVSDSTAFIDQHNSLQSSASVSQQESDHSLGNISQQHANNSQAHIQQRNSESAGNTAFIEQNGGDELSATLEQDGPGNWGKIRQTGDDQTAIIEQRSTAPSLPGNNAWIIQSSGANEGRILQFGVDNNASVHQF